MLEQWAALKEEIRSNKGLMSRKYHQLWAHMLEHFSEKYPLVLRLVVIALLIPTDTSECERIFSLMNDIKTAERSSLGQATLKHLMIWHTCAKGLACEEVPVLAILKEFRTRAGVRGRQPHRGQAVPKYDYTVETRPFMETRGLSGRVREESR